MAKVLQVDCSTGSGDIQKDFGSNYSEAFLYADVAIDPDVLTDFLTNGADQLVPLDIIQLSSHTFQNCGAEWYVDTGPTVIKWAGYNAFGDPASTPFTPGTAITSMQFYRVGIHVVA